MKILRSFSLIHFLPVIVILSLLPHLSTIPMVYHALNFSAILLFYIHDIRIIKLPHTFIKVILTALALVLIPIIYGFHFTQNIALVLLSSMSCLKLLEIKNYQDKRNIFIILFLGYFLIATYFLNNQSLFVSLYALFLLLLLTLSMAIFSRAPLTTIPIKPIFKIITKLTLYAIPLTIILFLFFPRVPGPLWTLPSDENSATTGLSGDMYPGSVNNISESNEIAFRVDFQGRVPDAKNLYWRGPVLTRTDGLSWQQSYVSEQRLKKSYQEIVTNNHDIIDYQVTLEPQKQRWIFTLEMPQSITSNFLKKPYLSRDLQYLVKHKISQVVQYHVKSATSFQLNIQEPEEKNLALLYPGGSNPKTFQLGVKWKNEIINKEEIIEKALNLFRLQDFYYTRTPPLMITNPADQFLFDAKRGFCEHYASSFVLLMRAAGIPARVITGYQGIEYNQLGDYYVVRQSNAHAWAEVWLENRGWVRIDPTSVVPEDHIDDSIFDYRSRDLAYLNINYADMNKLSQRFLADSWPLLNNIAVNLVQYVDQLKYTWNNWLLGYDREKQQILMNLLGFDYRWKTMVLFMFFLTFITFSSIFYLQILRSHQPEKAEVKSYKKLLKILTKHGLEVLPHQGPESIRKAASIHFVSQKEQIQRVFDYYIHLRYGKSSTHFSPQAFKKMVNNLKIS